MSSDGPKVAEIVGQYFTLLQSFIQVCYPERQFIPWHIYFPKSADNSY